MRTRDLLRALRKLGVPEAELQSTSDYDELMKIYRQYNPTEDPFDLAVFVETNWYTIATCGTIFLAIAGILYVYPTQELIEAIIPKSQTQTYIISFVTLLLGGQLKLASLRVVQLMLEWYGTYARLSAFATWVLPSDSMYRFFLAPMIHFPLSLDPKSKGMDVGPMVTLWLCGQAGAYIAKYVNVHVAKLERAERRKLKKLRSDEEKELKTKSKCTDTASDNENEVRSEMKLE